MTIHHQKKKRKMLPPCRSRRAWFSVNKNRTEKPDGQWTFHRTPCRQPLPRAEEARQPQHKGNHLRAKQRPVREDKVAVACPWLAPPGQSQIEAPVGRTPSARGRQERRCRAGRTFGEATVVGAARGCGVGEERAGGGGGRTTRRGSPWRARAEVEHRATSGCGSSHRCSLLAAKRERF